MFPDMLNVFAEFETNLRRARQSEGGRRRQGGQRLHRSHAINRHREVAIRVKEGLTLREHTRPPKIDRLTRIESLVGSSDVPNETNLNTRTECRDKMEQFLMYPSH